MTIEQELTKLNTNLTDSYTAVSNKGGTLPASENFDNLPNAINSITELKGETKTVNPTTSQQTITPSSGKNGITQVTVNAVTSAIDNNITTGNIKSGVSILGVNGTVTELKGETRSVSITSASGNTFTPTSGKNGITSITVTPTNQNRTVTPTTSQQTLSVNSGYSGNGTITVNAVTSTIDSDIKASNIKSGVNILGVNGTVTELAGETRTVSLTSSSSSGQTFTPSSGKNGITSITVKANNQARTVTPTTSSQSLTVNSGYSGNGTITVNAVTSSIDSDIVAGNIKSGVNILGVNGTLTPANNTSLSITPTTSAQSYTPSSPYTGYSPVNVSAVTSAIDSNIQAQFIRNGVQILGVTGTYGKPYVAFSVNGYWYDNWYINEDGELYGCGQGTYGQQGSGSTSDVLTFTKRADNAVQVACSQNTTWYINEDGELYGCGSNDTGQQGSGTSGSTRITTFTKRADNVVQVACHGGQSATSYFGVTWYINTDGELYGCGEGGAKQGSGDTSNVLTFTKRADNVKQMACSSSTTWYINEDGELYGCGSNNYGQQGSGSTSDVLTFTKRADNVVFVACSEITTWYLNESGELYGCGYNGYGQQGNGQAGISSSYHVKTFTKRADNVKQIVCSSSTTWYINEDGELYGCGYNNAGGQGSGGTSNVKRFTKRADNVKQMACWNEITWYVNTSNELYGCGSNNYGQQGSGDTTSVTTFTKRADNVVSVFCPGGTSTWYVNTSNELYGCGRNNYGQQGSGDTNNVLTFTKRN